MNRSIKKKIGPTRHIYDIRPAQENDPDYTGYTSTANKSVPLAFRMLKMGYHITGLWMDAIQATERKNTDQRQLPLQRHLQPPEYRDR